MKRNTKVTVLKKKTLPEKVLLGLTNVCDLPPEQDWRKLLDDVFENTDVETLLKDVRDQVMSQFGNNPLCLVAAVGHMVGLEKLLDYAEEHDLDIDHTLDTDENTPLHHAAVKGHVDILAKLIEAGASLTAVNRDGNTPFMMALAANLAAAELLWKHKDAFDINVRNKNGNNALQIVAYKNRTEFIERLVQETDNLTDVNEEGNTALMSAIQQGWRETLNAFWPYRYYFELDSANEAGQTALHLAAERKWDGCLTLLLHEKEEIPIDAGNNQGNTALAVAAKGGDIKCCKVLVKEGANILLYNERNFTAICEAFLEKHRDVGNYLLSNLPSEELTTYTQRYIDLLLHTPREVECDLPGGDESLHNILYCLYLSDHCREQMMRANLFEAWVQNIYENIHDAIFTETSMHFLMHILCNPLWGMRFKRHLAAQFMDSKCPDILVQMMQYLVDTGSPAFSPVCLLPLHCLGLHSEIGKEWLAENYHKLLPFKEYFEEEQSTFDYVSEIEEYQDKLWADLKRRIRDVQTVWSQRHAQELLALEEDEKAKEMRKKTRKRPKKRDAKGQSDKPIKETVPSILESTTENNKTHHINNSTDSSFPSKWTTDSPWDGEWMKIEKRPLKTSGKAKNNVTPSKQERLEKQGGSEKCSPLKATARTARNTTNVPTKTTKTTKAQCMPDSVAKDANTLVKAKRPEKKASTFAADRILKPAWNIPHSQRIQQEEIATQLSSHCNSKETSSSIFSNQQHTVNQRKSHLGKQDKSKINYHRPQIVDDRQKMNSDDPSHTKHKRQRSETLKDIAALLKTDQGTKCNKDNFNRIILDITEDDFDLENASSVYGVDTNDASCKNFDFVPTCMTSLFNTPVSATSNDLQELLANLGLNDIVGIDDDTYECPREQFESQFPSKSNGDCITTVSPKIELLQESFKEINVPTGSKDENEGDNSITSIAAKGDVDNEREYLVPDAAQSRVVSTDEQWTDEDIIPAIDPTISPCLSWLTRGTLTWYDESTPHCSFSSPGMTLITSSPIDESISWPQQQSELEIETTAEVSANATQFSLIRPEENVHPNITQDECVPTSQDSHINEHLSSPTPKDNKSDALQSSVKDSNTSNEGTNLDEFNDTHIKENTYCQENAKLADSSTNDVPNMSVSEDISTNPSTDKNISPTPSNEIDSKKGDESYDDNCGVDANYNSPENVTPKSKPAKENLHEHEHPIVEITAQNLNNIRVTKSSEGVKEQSYRSNRESDAIHHNLLSMIPNTEAETPALIKPVDKTRITHVNLHASVPIKKHFDSINAGNIFEQLAPKPDIWYSKHRQDNVTNLQYINRKWPDKSLLLPDESQIAEIIRGQWQRIGPEKVLDFVGGGDYVDLSTGSTNTPECGHPMQSVVSPPCQLDEGEVQNLLPAFLLSEEETEEPSENSDVDREPSSSVGDDDMDSILPSIYKIWSPGTEQAEGHVNDIFESLHMDEPCNRQPSVYSKNTDCPDSQPITTIITPRYDHRIDFIMKSMDDYLSGEAAPQYDQTDAVFYVNQLSEVWREKMRIFASLPGSQRSHCAQLYYSTEPSFSIGKSSFRDALLLGTHDNGMELAIKRTSLATASTIRELVNDLPDVVRVHERLLPYIAVCNDLHYGYIAYPLAECNLRQRLHELKARDQLAPPIQRSMVQQMLEGLAFLHQNEIVHGRLSPSNVLIDVEGGIRLADFGTCSKHKYRLLPREEGKRYWRSSEVPVTGDVAAGKMSDIQVSGMLFYYILTAGDHPCGRTPADVQVNITRGWPKPREISSDVDDLLRSMLAFVAKTRPTAKEVLGSLFFWSDQKRYDFLIAVFQQFVKNSNGRQEIVNRLNSIRIPELIHGKTWMDVMDRFILRELTSYGRNSLYTPHIVSLLRFMDATHTSTSMMSSSAKQVLQRPPMFYLSRYKSLPSLVYHKLTVKELAQLQRFFM